MSTDNSETLKPYIEHLEFLGFTVGPTNEEKQFFRATNHPTRWNLVFWPFRRGIYFAVSFASEDVAKVNQLDILKFANSLNNKFFICRAVIDKDIDLNIEANFLGRYDKREFGIFLDDIESEIRNAMESNKDEAKRLLK